MAIRKVEELIEKAKGEAQIENAGLKFVMPAEKVQRFYDICEAFNLNKDSLGEALIDELLKEQHDKATSILKKKEVETAKEGGVGRGRRAASAPR